MKTKIRNLVTFVLLSAASLTMLFGSPNTQPSRNPQTQPDISVPGIVSNSSDSGGMRTRADTDLPSVRYGSHIDLNQPGVTLEQLDARSLTLEPNQIGANRSVEVSPNTRAQKFLNPDGSQIIVLIIKSSGASGVGVHFRNFALIDGEEVYVYGAAGDSIVFGPFTDKGPWGSGEFWSGTVDGDTVVIEFYKRNDENGQGFEIFEISHILAELDWRLRSNEPDVLNCEVDASCNRVSENDAVGRILFNDNGPRVCTGTLLNDLAQDQIPYFLTANHCVPTQAVAQTVEVYWFYQTTSCNSGVLRSWVHSPPGANLLAGQSANDFSLLRLQNNAPGGTWFSGWTSVAQPTGTSVFGLHHPDGYTPPSIPSYLRRVTGSIVSTNVNCGDSGLVNGYIAAWTSGTSEEGSSGSALFTSNGHYVVGVLSCGPQPPTCNNPDGAYSKFSNFYSQIQPYIGGPAPVATDFDFNNDGKPDYALYNASTHQTRIWYMNNNVRVGSASGPTINAGWSPVSVADFNRDGHIDALLFNPTTRQTWIGYLVGVTLVASNYGPTLPGGWEIVATGDFNRNGHPDFVLYNSTTHQTVIWYMNNNVRVGGASGPNIPGGWSLVAVADFNENGYPDYLLFNSTTHQTSIWYMNNNVRVGGASGPNIPGGWSLVGAADFNRNGRPDYLLYNASTHQTSIWYMNNNVRVGGASGPNIPGGWSLFAP